MGPKMRDVYKRVTGIRRRRERGAAMLTALVALVALLAMASLAIDGGAMWTARSQMQNSVDSAALAAVCVVTPLRRCIAHIVEETQHRQRRRGPPNSVMHFWARGLGRPGSSVVQSGWRSVDLLVREFGEACTEESRYDASVAVGGQLLRL